MSVKEIVEQVFADHASVANFQFKLDRSYRPRVYCVQYRETDFNFIARLLEEEGIHWYFEHAAGEHKLVLVDDPSFHEPDPGCEKLPFYGNPGQVPPGKEAKDWKTAMNQFAKLYEDRFTRAANGTA